MLFGKLNISVSAREKYQNNSPKSKIKKAKTGTVSAFKGSFANFKTGKTAVNYMS
jgi:hypothetical protein